MTACPKCGIEVAESARFCSQCGAAVPTGGAAPRGASPKKVLPVLPLVILVGGVLAVVLVLLLVRGGGAPPAGQVLGGAPPAGQVLGSALPAEQGLGDAPTPATAAGGTTGAVLVSATDTSAGGSTAAAAGGTVVGSAVVSTPAAQREVSMLPVPQRHPDVEATYRCRKGADFNVSPEDAEIEIDGKVIGKADDWDDKGGGETFHFEKPGTYYVKLTCEHYHTAWIKIIVSPDADEKTADVDFRMREVKEHDKDEDD